MQLTLHVLVTVNLLATFHLGAAHDATSWASDNLGWPKVGPWGLSNDAFSTFFSQPNATGIYPISGPNVSLDGSTGFVHGWQWHIAVRADIPLNASNYTDFDKDDFPGEVFTGAQIILQTPGNTARAVETCLMQWDMGFGYSDALRHDDGTCSTVLSDSCRSDMANAISANWTLYGCVCPDMSAISSCGTPPPAPFNASCVAYAYNSTSVNTQSNSGLLPGYWNNGSMLTQEYGGPPASPGNITAYNLTGSLAWPVMVAWNTGSNIQPNVNSQLVCARASNATADSQVPGTNSTSSATNFNDIGYGSGLLGILAVTLASILLALI